MSENWLKQNFQMTKEFMSHAPQLLAYRQLSLPSDFDGLLLRANGPSGTPFIIVAPNSSTHEKKAVSKLIALAILDSKARLLFPTFMPDRFAHAFLKANGKIFHQVIRTLPVWAHRECDRISNLLLDEYKQFVDDFMEALLTGSTLIFKVPPADIPLISSPDEMFSFEPPFIKVDLSGFDRRYNGVEKHKIVSMEYERDRYMKHLSFERFIERANDIMRNIHQIDEMGRITLENEDPRLYYWMDRFAEVIHESCLRKIPKDVFGHGATKEYPFPIESDRPERIAHSVAAVKVHEDAYLVRYGKFEHILEAYENGRIRLGPAASYADPLFKFCEKRR